MVLNTIYLPTLVTWSNHNGYEILNLASKFNVFTLQLHFPEHLPSFGVWKIAIALNFCVHNLRDRSLKWHSRQSTEARCINGMLLHIKKRKFKEKPVQLIRHWQVPSKFPKIASSFARRIPWALKKIWKMLGLCLNSRMVYSFNHPFPNQFDSGCIPPMARQ
jgi:hypothetical protein